MKKMILYSVILLTTTIVSAQKTENTHDSNSKSKNVVKLFEDNSEAKFESDLKSGKLTIYLLGGIVSVIRKIDSEFEKEYQINYRDFGCTPPSNFEFYENYNQLVFHHLLKQHGKKWIVSANNNAFGFDKWKIKNG